MATAPTCMARQCVGCSAKARSETSSRGLGSIPYVAMPTPGGHGLGSQSPLGLLAHTLDGPDHISPGSGWGMSNAASCCSATASTHSSPAGEISQTAFDAEWTYLVAPVKSGFGPWQDLRGVPEHDRGLLSYRPERSRTYVYRRAGEDSAGCVWGAVPWCLEDRNVFRCLQCQTLMTSDKGHTSPNPRGGTGLAQPPAISDY